MVRTRFIMLSFLTLFVVKQYKHERLASTNAGASDMVSDTVSEAQDTTVLDEVKMSNNTRLGGVREALVEQLKECEATETRNNVKVMHA